MANSDSELIDQVRALTDYHEDVISDAKLQALVDIGREELLARFNDQEFEFYQEETHSADRALFWFTCIAAKVKAGEIAGISITVDEIQAAAQSGAYDHFWLSNFDSRLREAESQLYTPVSTRVMERDNRSYGDL